MTGIPALESLGDRLEQAISQHNDVGERRQRRSRRWLAAAIATAVGCAIVLGVGAEGGHDSPSVGPLRINPASAKVTVRDVGGFYEVRLANVLADPEAIRQALRRHGLNLDIQFIPSSPSLVDKAVMSSGPSDVRERVRWTYRQASSVEQDLVSVSVPQGYRGELGLAIGRRARPGERYASSAVSAQLPGEALHCADIEGRRVRDILSVLEQRHLAVRWHVLQPTGRFVDLQQVIDWYVNTAVPYAPGEVRIIASQTQPDRSRINPAYLARMREGCPPG
jgi:hypothetical protein